RIVLSLARMNAAQLKTLLQRRVRRTPPPRRPGAWLAALVVLLGFATFYMCCERDVMSGSANGVCSVGEIIDLERDAAAIEAFALAQQQQAVSRNLPRRTPDFAGETQLQRRCVGLAIDFIEIDIVSVRFLPFDRVCIYGIDG